MKKYLSILLATLASFASFAQVTTIEQANALAQEGKFSEASQAYEAILANGQESAHLYYNLGYSYYKQGLLGRAIINMERAKRLSPSDPDIQTNLELAYAQTDRMQIVEPFFLETWWQDFKDSLTSDGWAVTFVLTFFLMLCGIAAFLFLNSVPARKAGFFSAIALFFIAAFSLSLSVKKRAEILNSNDAIIMSASVTLSTSPDKNGSQMAVLHEGTHVHILSSLGEWIEVRLKDGNVGWLKATDVERI